MAKQHFYSRVPARMSMFNKTDSFDTFAYSDGLEDEFIEKELSLIYDNKPSKNDASLIRDGQLPPIFLNLNAKSGVFAQGCISFLPLDYTGERSSYLAHTIIPSEEEAKALIDNPDNAIMNPDMFKKNLDGFSLTDSEAKPDDKYPDLKYKKIKAESTDILLEYDSAMMKRLIFAMINLACGKGKTIFISLPAKLSDFSGKALQFINTVLQIFPYSLRRSFSFVTYTDDATRFPAFNIRFIPEHMQEIPAAKGITLHLGFKIAVGLSDEVVASSAMLVDFFYGLIRNDSMRKEFLLFMDNAVKQVPELQKLNIKTLNELVFLFQQCSGLFNEKNILPNDGRMFDYVCAYEKHRLALSDEYRAVALKCLTRYPQNHQPIPKDVFSRVSKIYPSEPISSKRNVMSVVLDLIHTDVMRDKLFSFIKANYKDEDADIRATICKDLCRVYYGGFLQLQLINFFDENFGTEPEEIKDIILEKLLLTIRTTSIRARIIEFWDRNYGNLTDKQKAQLYNTFYEMLPGCDATATDMLALIDKHIDSESEEFKSSVNKEIYTLVEANQKHKEPKLMSLLFEKSAFGANAVTSEVFGHSENKIFASYVKKFHEVPLDKKIQIFEGVWKCVPDMSEKVADRFANTLIDSYKECDEKEKYDLFAYVEIDKVVSSHLDGNAAEKLFAEKVLGTLVHPAIERTLTQAFSVKRKKDGLDFIIDYSKDKQYIKDIPSYESILNYIALTDAVQSKNYPDVISSSEKFTDKTMCQNVAEHLKMSFIDNDTFAGEENISAKYLLEVLIGYMKTQAFDFSASHTSICGMYAKSVTAANPKLTAEAVQEEAEKKAILKLFECANTLYVSSIAAEEKEKIAAESTSFAKIVSAFITNRKKGKKYISEQLETNKYDAALTEKIKAISNKASAASGGFFARLFGKK